MRKARIGRLLITLVAVMAIITPLGVVSAQAQLAALSPQWVHVSGTLDMGAVDSRATRDIDGYFGFNEFYVRSAHPSGAPVEEFAFDGSPMRVIITDPTGAKGVAESSPTLFVADSIRWPESMTALLSGRKGATTTVSRELYGGTLTLHVQPVSDTPSWTSQFDRKYESARSGGIGLTDTGNGAPGSILGVQLVDAEPSAAKQLMSTTAGSGARDGWIYEIGLGGVRCVYMYNYRDFGTSYFYGSSTAYNNCYWVGVSLWGDSQTMGDGSCEVGGWWLGFAGWYNPRAYKTATWPDPVYGERRGACSNHAGYDQSWAMIAPWTGINAASP